MDDTFKMYYKELSCKENYSCTFLDLFLFILFGIVNFKDFSCEQYITPNVLLTITKKTSNKYKLSFQEKNTRKGIKYISCELNFYLEYDRNLDKVNFIEHTYKNNDYYKRKGNRVNKEEIHYYYEKEGTYDCNSFNCLKQTFQHFLYLFNLCDELFDVVKYPIDYRSQRFSIEKHYCEAETQNIINEIRRIRELFAPPIPPTPLRRHDKAIKKSINNRLS